MTRAFLYAGTPAISVTLWEVDDQVAPQITPAFFAGMGGGLSATDALRQAKLKLLHSPNAPFRHPYAWAPTVIFGDGSNSRAGQPDYLGDADAAGSAFGFGGPSTVAESRQTAVRNTSAICFRCTAEAAAASLLIF